MDALVSLFCQNLAFNFLLQLLGYNSPSWPKLGGSHNTDHYMAFCRWFAVKLAHYSERAHSSPTPIGFRFERHSLFISSFSCSACCCMVYGCVGILHE